MDALVVRGCPGAGPRLRGLWTELLRRLDEFNIALEQFVDELVDLDALVLGTRGELSRNSRPGKNRRCWRCASESSGVKSADRIGEIVIGTADSRRGDLMMTSISMHTSAMIR